MGFKSPYYSNLISKEAKAFDNQAILRLKKGLVPDLRKLKKNTFFYNNPYREPEFYNIQWKPIIDKIISKSWIIRSRITGTSFPLGLNSLRRCASMKRG